MNIIPWIILFRLECIVCSMRNIVVWEWHRELQWQGSQLHKENSNTFDFDFLSFFQWVSKMDIRNLHWNFNLLERHGWKYSNLYQRLASMFTRVITQPMTKPLFMTQKILEALVVPFETTLLQHIKNCEGSISNILQKFCQLCYVEKHVADLSSFFQLQVVITKIT